jgi:hypothetical protein
MSNTRDKEIAFALAGLMLRYQKENKVKKQCVTNVQYLFDQLILHGVKCKAKPAIVCNKTHIIRGHVVIVLDDGTIVDPSYEIAQLQDTQYIGNIKVFSSLLKYDDSQSQSKEDFLKQTITDFLDFNKLAEDINKSQHCKSFIITDKEHYNKQADYIDAKSSLWAVSTYLEKQENRENQENREKAGCR